MPDFPETGSEGLVWGVLSDKLLGFEPLALVGGMGTTPNQFEIWNRTIVTKATALTPVVTA